MDTSGGLLGREKSELARFVATGNACSSGEMGTRLTRVDASQKVALRAYTQCVTLIQ